ncbi:hypothetical protein TNCV_1295531 [Trichonephila clavipes]|nr:hypothetical protein TNCV_1295531 [Trichonephila clavipes]
MRRSNSFSKVLRKRVRSQKIVPLPEQVRSRIILTILGLVAVRHGLAVRKIRLNINTRADSRKVKESSISIDSVFHYTICLNCSLCLITPDHKPPRLVLLC